MTIVFYSTVASRFDEEAFSFYTWPRRSSVWSDVCARYPEHTFCLVTQKPARFLLDGERPDELPACMRVTLLPEDAGATELSEAVLSFAPDLAIAASCWAPPYDWLGVQDSLVADMLRARGVRVLSHATSLSLDCFDKRRTHERLENLGFLMPRSVYVHHELYWCERQHHELTRNVYKEAVLEAVKQLRYPVVIKDTVGLSSYSMEVAVSYKQALAYLNSGRTKVDRIVEEYIAGEQFGVELYAARGTCSVFPPLMFSLNRYGITSPKQSVKLGGKWSEAAENRFHFSELRAMLLRLSDALEFSGPAQIDLVHSDTPAPDGRHWYIIEINPRLSGMSETYAASLNRPLVELLLATALEEPLPVESAQCVCNIKLPILDEKALVSLSEESAVAYIHQIHNKAARQEREKGYCELVLASQDMPSLMAALDDLASRYATCMESAFVEKAHELFLRS